MDYLYITCTRKHRAYCVFIGSTKFALNIFHLKSVSHIIYIPRLLGLYGENIGPPLQVLAVGT